jgi:single-strand DNA-binding protein
MSMSNEFRIHGNLASDVRRSATAGGVATAFYVVAVDHQYRTDDGVKSSTDFIPITTYGKQAENDHKYLAKGKEVSIRGRIRTWYDSKQKRGGFCFEPDPGCVRYIGAPITQPVEQVISEEHDSWLMDYDAAASRFDVAPPTRPAR